MSDLPDKTPNVSIVDQAGTRTVSVITDGSTERLAVATTLDLTGTAGDSFSRLRVSAPESIFDSKLIFDKNPLFWNESLETGSGITSTHSTNTSDVTLQSTINTAGKFTRQTFIRFNYQPGKSQLLLITGNLLSSGGGTGVITRLGLFDDNNGVFFEYNAGTINVVLRSSITGSPVDTAVPQSSWNIDKMDGTGDSGFTVDFTKSQIFVVDFQWLGTGLVRFSIEADGIIYPVHSIYNGNIRSSVYMSVPNLPVRYQMVTTGSSPASSMKCICNTVVSEGGREDLGVIRYKSTDDSVIHANASGTLYALVGIRLKSTALAATVKVLNVTVMSSTSNDYEWCLVFNPTVAGSFTFGDETNSPVQTGIGNTANPSTTTVTGGLKLAGGYVKAGSGAGAFNQIINTALILGASIANVRDEIYLCVRPLSNNANILGGFTWREIA